VVTSGVTLATLFVLAPLIGLMPSATLAAVVVVSSASLIKIAEFRDILRTRKMEFIWAIIAFAGVVLLGTLRGILIAVIISLLALAQQAYSPTVYAMGRKRGTQVFRPISRENPDDETWAGFLILRVEGRVFFANAQRVGDKIWPLIEQANPSVVVIDCSSIIDIEYTALKMLSDAEETLRRNGIRLWLAALNPQVFATVSQSELGDRLGQQQMFLDIPGALDHYQRVEVHLSPK
jgi:MFS superfamily sulfate permease-like transporter